MKHKIRNRTIDGIRGIAVLMVFLSHSSGRGQYLSKYLDFHGIGHVGVYLFFSLSAFLLGLGIFQNNIDNVLLKKYFVKRTLRIIPLYYVVILSVFSFQQLTNGYNSTYLYIDGGVRGLIEHLIFYRGDGIFWTILTEVQFYVLLPIIAVLLLKKRKKRMIILLIIAVANFTFYIISNIWRFQLMNLISLKPLGRGTFIDVFACGLIAANISVNYKRLLKSKLTLTHKYASIFFILLLVLTVILVSKNFLGFNRPYYELRFFSMIYGFVFSLYILTSYNSIHTTKVLHIKFLRFIGIIGFSFYLLHMTAIQLVNLTNFQHNLKFILSFILTTTLSTLTFYLIEKPGIKLSYLICSKFKK